MTVPNHPNPLDRATSVATSKSWLLRVWRLLSPANLLSGDPVRALLPCALLIFIARTCLAVLVALADSSFAGREWISIADVALVFAGLIGVLACVGIPAAFVGTLLPSVRKGSAFSAVLCVALLLNACGTIKARKKLQDREIRYLAVDARPVIDAINAYDAKNQAPPSRLQDLVPEYLPRIPPTPFWWMSDYDLWTDARPQQGNRWALVVYDHSPLVTFNWIVYLPNPPAVDDLSGYQGTARRIGDWAYVDGG